MKHQHINYFKSSKKISSQSNITVWIKFIVSMSNNNSPCRFFRIHLNLCF